MVYIFLILNLLCTFAQNTTNGPKTDKTIANTSGTPANATVSTTSEYILENTTDDANITTEMTLTTVCDVNCSVSTQEPMSNKTTPVPKNRISKSDVPKQIGRTETKTYRTKESCICDLQLNICDINCCCDEDCSPDDKLIFHHCEAENLYYDTRYCDYMKYIYINNTPLEWHVNQNGLFCIVKSNLPPSYTVQRKQPLPSFAGAKLEKLNKFSWSRSSQNKIVFNASEGFIYGNNVWVVHVDEIKKLQLPKNFHSSTCITWDDVLNMKNIQSSCTQIDISEENKQLNFESYFLNITIVAAPNLLNISKYKNNFEDCPKNICLPIFAKVCDKNFNECKNVSEDASQLKVTCNFDIRHNKNDCKNALKKLQYNFYHNGTKGYSKIELLGVLENISYEFGKEDFQFYQEFNVNFYWINQTNNLSIMLSGNPGYLIGKPILIGDLVNKGNKTNVILKIERSSVDHTRTFITLPENMAGICVLDNEHYLSVDFGYNLLTKCKLRSTVFNRKKNFNGTETCRNIQKTILRLWGITNSNKMIGMFGNADANNPKEWIKVLYSISPEDLLNQTIGQYYASNNSVICFGMVTNLVINIYHSKINFKSILNQEKILAVTYSFEELVNKSLVYNKQYNSTSFEFDLENQVVFYDVSVQKQSRFVDPPSLEIKLPYDFFYPFIKVENKGNAITVKCFICIYMYLLLVMVE